MTAALLLWLNTVTPPGPPPDTSVRHDIWPGDLCWYQGDPVRVRLVGYGIGVPGEAHLDDGRQVPVADIVTRHQIARNLQGVGW